MFKGRIRGFPNAPFARNGPGWLHKPARVPHPSQTKPPRPACILKGYWVNDQLVTKRAELLASNNGEEDPSRVLAKDVTECRACLSVFQHTSLTEHGAVHLCPKARDSRHSTSPRPVRPRSKGKANAKPEPDDKCVIVGLHDGVAQAFVLQRLSFSDGSRLGGGAGARCFASYDTQEKGRSVCHSATCRNAILCNMRDTCPHIEEIQKKIKDGSSIVSSGLTLDGFLALSSDAPMDLRPRRCLAEFCSERAPSKSKAEAANDNAPAAACSNAAEDSGGSGVQEDVRSKRGAFSDGDVSEESELESYYDSSDDDARTVQLEEQESYTAYTYTPEVDEILRMTTPQLRALCDQLSFNTRACVEVLQHTLVEYYHPEAVSTLGAKQQDAAKAQKAPAPPPRKKVKKVGGAVGRAPDADAAARNQDFKFAARARRCVKGSMCMEHAAQKLLGARWHEKLDAVDPEHEELQPSTADDSQKHHDPTTSSTGVGAAPAGSAVSPLGGRCTSPSCTDTRCDTSADAGGFDGEVSVSEFCASCGDDDPSNASTHGYEAIVDGSAFPVAMAVATDAGEMSPSNPMAFAHSIKSMKLRRHGAGAACASTSCTDPSCKTAAAPSPADPSGIPDDVQEIEIPETKTRTKLFLTPTMVDDFLYSITLAKARSTMPVIPITAHHYAVLRSEADECSYSCPGGYSLVKAVLREDKDKRGSSILSLSCNCSEYRSCRSGMGGRSKKGSARFCTCCSMVVAASILDAPIERIVNGDSAWLLAGRRHEKVCQTCALFAALHAPSVALQPMTHCSSRFYIAFISIGGKKNFQWFRSRITTCAICCRATHGTATHDASQLTILHFTLHSAFSETILPFNELKGKGRLRLFRTGVWG